MVFLVRVCGFAYPGGRPLPAGTQTWKIWDGRKWVTQTVHIDFGSGHNGGGSEWSDASGRPTVGDTVRLKVSKEGLSKNGDICEVMQDNNDSTPYKLKKVGTSSVKGYFRTADVQKVVRGRSRPSYGGTGNKPWQQGTLHSGTKFWWKTGADGQPETTFDDPTKGAGGHTAGAQGRQNQFFCLKSNNHGFLI
eukprot:SAG31_NODE_227_length_19818_cov_6.503271_20_plen_192_part_00